MEINYNDIDEKCIPMVKFFNSVGLTTKYSCQGHDSTNARFYIMFEESVCDENIIDFLTKFGNKYDHTPFVGMFQKWTRKISGVIQGNWSYSVCFGDYKINQRFAQLDLEKMNIVLQQNNEEENEL